MPTGVEARPSLGGCRSLPAIVFRLGNLLTLTSNRGLTTPSRAPRPAAPPLSKAIPGLASESEPRPRGWHGGWGTPGQGPQDRDPVGRVAELSLTPGLRTTLCWGPPAPRPEPASPSPIESSPWAPWLGLRSDLGPWCPPPAAGETEAGDLGAWLHRTAPPVEAAHRLQKEPTVPTPAPAAPKPSPHPQAGPKRPNLPLNGFGSSEKASGLLVSRRARSLHRGHQGVQSPRPLPLGATARKRRSEPSPALGLPSEAAGPSPHPCSAARPRFLHQPPRRPVGRRT